MSTIARAKRGAQLSQIAIETLTHQIKAARNDPARDATVSQWLTECPDCGGDLQVGADGKTYQLTESGFEASTGDTPMSQIPAECETCDQVFPLSYFFIDTGLEELQRDFAGGTEKENVTVEVNLTNLFGFPQGSVILESYDGQHAGIRLPSGEVVKPWIVFELYRNAAGDEICQDLTDQQIEERGIQNYIELKRRINGDLPVEPDK